MLEKAILIADNNIQKEVDIVTDQHLNSKFPLKILVAEDNETNLKIVMSLLSKMGYKVQSVINGQEAVEKIKMMDFDIVFMDIQMPVMDGLEATVKIKNELPKEKQPLIIALTANSGIEDKQGCFNAGMVDHITKPVNLDILQQTLMKWGNYISTHKMQ